MKQKINKLILLFIMMFSLVITLVGTTYAFIIISNDADIDEINVSLENQEGLLISLDGTTFYNHISSDMLIEAIEAYQGNVKSFEEFEFKGVTLKNLNESTSLDLTDNKFHPLMDQEEPIRDSSGNPDYLSGKRVHSFKEASMGSYVAFDVWFRIINGANTLENEKDYGLYFNEYTKMECSPMDITIYNKLTTLDKEYNTNDSITVNPKDAMRIAVLTHNEELTVNIFEPYTGLGSSAIASYTDTLDENHYIHDPNKNAMYTYYQNSNPLSKFTQAADDSVQFDTIGLAGLYTTQLGLFKYNHNATNDVVYNDVKITVMIYLDGWDADYLPGVTEATIKMALGFGIKATE